MSFIHLHVYSAYSLLTSTATVDQLVRDARAKGFSALALTDRNVLYGTVAFYKECLKNSIKPLLGLTVDVVSPVLEQEAFPLVLLAKNNQGFQNLIKISSAVQTKSPEGIPVKWLKHYASGLYAMTPGTEGEVEYYLSNGEKEKALETVEFYKKIFGGQNFYLSLQNQGIPGQTDLIQQLAKLGAETKTPLIAANQVHYLDKVDSFAQECLLAIKNGEKLQDDARQKLGSNEFYLKTAREMSELLSEYPEALENTLKIADDCNVMLDFETRHLPKYPVGQGKSADQMLEELCYKGLKERYGNPSEQHVERLKYELSVIKKMKFSDYFLIVWDFINYAKEKGILVGPGRGSAAGSIVAYVLYITDADPIEHDLLFERFLNPERISMPDIDIDFPDNRRDEVIEYVASKYGELHVAQIATFGTLAAKAAVRDVGRVFGLNAKELDRLSKLVPSRLGITLKDALHESKGLRDFVEESEKNKRIIETAIKLEGLPRHTSTHAAGVVISEQPLTNVVPIQAGQSNVFLTQYSMDHLEEIGLLKMDFLGLRNLTLIDTILHSIQQKTRQKIGIHEIPYDDKKTFELLSRGETTGIFQLESEGMRKVLTKLEPTRFEDIVAVNALYRPGPMENIPLFIDRKHGRKPIDFYHKDLEDILGNTYGVIVYQEQIMQIASKMAGFTLGEADLLRRAVSKKKKEVLDQEREHFVNGALGKGYDDRTASQIYDLIVRFANYGFNRSHAVAYSMIAYQLAYLKAHFPLYFMAALLTSAIGNDVKIAQYARELQQMGIKLLPPSINKSSFSFQPEGEAVRYSLAGIKGVGLASLKDIFHARRTQPFKDIFDFCIRVPDKTASRKVLEALVYSGSFDEFGQDRAVLLATIDVALEHAQLVAPDDSGQIDMFAEAEFSLKPKYIEVDPIRIEDKLSLEKDVLGVYLSRHPVSIHEKEFQAAGVKTIASKQAGKVRLGVYVTEQKKIRTKKGEPMAFLTLSDASGETEAVVFPTVYKQHGNNLAQGKLTLVEGKFEERDGRSQFIVQHVLDLEKEASKTQQKKPAMYLRIVKGTDSAERMNKLKALLRKHHGAVPVIVYMEETEKSILLPDEFNVSTEPGSVSELKKALGDNNVVLKN
ncbi:DNA polymerase III subunit alpha [Mesobacillus subterraneus]|uniref:DNA polymerase III subunit alpha n=1 Tax=Mesobacillus subterraneus TaxID=285983 RepID=A0A427TTG2_9BACI|nr:DNA polymerase III subunit alpha [Mesobacillus subterraneus]RSD27704.1 DNA polymerase III subunit alpha [Mesobacillus subterraneus]